MPEGIICSAIGGFYEIKNGESLYTCKAKGLFRHKGLIPLPGDKVVFETQKDGYARIEKVLERRNTIKRPAVANIDTLFIVLSAQLPEPDFLLADKLILEAVKNNIEPILIINKIDSADIALLEKIDTQYKCFSLLQVSTYVNKGIDLVKKRINNHICCFAGQSGVGKSSIINSLFQSTIMKTGVISNKTEHGRHTTRETRLFECCGGYIFDTPGFSLLETEGFDASILLKAYPEFVTDKPCRFLGCNHIHEPGCAVKEKITSGEVDLDRYKRYIILYEEFENRRKHRYD